MQDQALDFIGDLSSEPIKIAQLYRAKVAKANGFAARIAEG